jgi:hypothetical protein
MSYGSKLCISRSSLCIGERPTAIVSALPSSTNNGMRSVASVLVFRREISTMCHGVEARLLKKSLDLKELFFLRARNPFGSASALKMGDADGQRDRRDRRPAKCPGSTHKHESAFRRLESI